MVQQSMYFKDQAVREVSEQLDEAHTAIENTQLLIAEYKDKNDSLTGLVTKYQGYVEENEQLKVAFAKEKEALLTAATDKQQLEQTLTAATNQVKANETKAIELEKALAEEKRRLNKRLQVF